MTKLTKKIGEKKEVRLKRICRFTLNDLEMLESIFDEYAGKDTDDKQILKIKSKMYIGINEDINKHIAYLERKGYKIVQIKK